jgi:hypothetical protein
MADEDTILEEAMDSGIPRGPASEGSLTTRWA